jgi:hypothetical protein
MSYYEYVFSGNLTTEYEERSKQLLNEVNTSYVPYVIHKYIDEEIEGKKHRTIIIHSHLNLNEILLTKFVNCGLEMRVYYKQQII